MCSTSSNFKQETTGNVPFIKNKNIWEDEPEIKEDDNGKGGKCLRLVCHGEKIGNLGGKIQHFEPIFSFSTWDLESEQTSSLQVGVNKGARFLSKFYKRTRRTNRWYKWWW